MNLFNKFVVLMGAVVTLLIVSCSDSPPSDNNDAEEKAAVEANEVVFAIYTADKASTTVAEFAPVIEWLERELKERLGEPYRIRMKVSNQYLQGISDITEGQADFSRLGPASYILAAKENPKLEILAMESKNGERVFKGIVAVHADSVMKSLEDLKGKSFAFGDPLSTIGRYLSQAELLKVGIEGADLSKFEYLGRHDTVGMAVAAGDFDAGALKSSSFKKLVKAGCPIKVLSDFDNVTKPWVSHPRLDPEVRDALRSAMLEISEEEAEKVSLDGFLESAPEFYESIRVAMDVSKEFLSSPEVANIDDTE